MNCAHCGVKIGPCLQCARCRRVVCLGCAATFPRPSWCLGCLIPGAYEQEREKRPELPAREEIEPC